MPVSRSNPLPELRTSLQVYQRRSGKLITLEIVLLGGVNDRSQDIEALLRFIGYGPRQLKVLVNLIPFNSSPDLPYRGPDAVGLTVFRERLERAGVSVTTRFRRGRGILGACGQLAVGQNRPNPPDSC